MPVNEILRGLRIRLPLAKVPPAVLAVFCIMVLSILGRAFDVRGAAMWFLLIIMGIMLLIAYVATPTKKKKEGEL
jgi:L-asparagine transporter-like permease